MRHATQVEVAFVGWMRLDFVIVNKDTEILGGQGLELSDSSDEAYCHLGRERAQHLALRHVDADDGDVVDAFFRQHVGDEHYLQMVGGHFDSFHCLRTAIDCECVAETGVVEMLGLDIRDTVKFLARCIHRDAVGIVLHL